MSRPAAGDKAPHFSGLNQRGETISLDKFAGKKIALYFYPKDDTPGCTAEACNLRDNHSALQAAGYVVIGVSSDSVKSHDKFATKYSLPFDLLADEDKSTHEAYGTWVEKSMYGRKYMGTDRVTFIINEQGVIDKVIDKVKTKEHTAQIL
jgi:thioredoxin-dependent peroxiredoxin